MRVEGRARCLDRDRLLAAPKPAGGPGHAALRGVLLDGDVSRLVRRPRAHSRRGVPALSDLLEPLGSGAPRTLLSLTRRVTERLTDAGAGAASSGGRPRAPTAADSGPAVTVTATLPGGVRAVATGSSSGAGDFNIAYEFSKRGYAVQIETESRDSRSLDECPSAHGVVSGTSTSKLRLTYIARRGRSIEGSATLTVETSHRARARVDDRARLDSFVLAITRKISHARRASQWSATVSQQVTIDVPAARAGRATAYGNYVATATADLRRLDLYASGAEIATAERKLAAELLTQFGRESLAGDVESWLEALTEAEKGWNEPNRCVEIDFSPEPGTVTVAVGERGSFTGQVRTRTGAATRGRWSAESGSTVVGGVTPLPNASTAAAPARFQYSGEDGPGEDSVSVSLRVTSPAGVGMRQWTAGEPPPPPQTYSGHFSGREDIYEAYATVWSGTATFEFDPTPETNAHGCGYLNVACYDLVSATVTWHIESGSHSPCSWSGGPKTTTLPAADETLILEYPAESPGYYATISMVDSVTTTISCPDGGGGSTPVFAQGCCLSTGDGTSLDQTALEGGRRLAGTRTTETGDGEATYTWNFTAG